MTEKLVSKKPGAVQFVEPDTRKIRFDPIHVTAMSPCLLPRVLAQIARHWLDSHGVANRALDKTFVATGSYGFYEGCCSAETVYNTCRSNCDPRIAIDAILYDE